MCGATWGGNYILPFACPAVLQSKKELHTGWPIPETEHAALRQSTLDALHAEGCDIDRVPMGATFQPLHIKFGSIPQSNFLWPTLGSVVVSARVKRLFEAQGVTGAAFCPAVIDKIGKRKSTGPAPVPSTGEPEDIIEEAEAGDNLAQTAPLYEMVVTARSGRPPGAEPFTVCPGCTRENYDRDKRRLILTQAMLAGTDVFILETTLHIIVSDKVRNLITRNRLTNSEFTPITL